MAGFWEHHNNNSPSQEGEGCFCAQVIEQVRQVMKENDQVSKHLRLLGEASYRLFVDLTSPYGLRLGILKYFWGISEERAYGHVQRGLATVLCVPSSLHQTKDHRLYHAN
jgi:hypothetical protein